MKDEKHRELVGQASIQSHFQKEIDKRWKQLSRKYVNVKGELLFALFIMITELSHSLEMNNRFDVDDYLRLPMFLLTLDEFLVRGWNSVIPPEEREIQTYIDRVIHDFLQIGYLKNRALESAAYNEEKITLEPGKKLHELPSQIEPAFQEWTSHRSQDEDWINYYYDKSTVSLKLNRTLKREFQSKYGITVQQLSIFESALGNTALKQREAGGNLPLPFVPQELVRLMVEIMSKVDAIEEDVARSFLRELEYSPGRFWFRSPLVKVKKGREIRYTPILPALFLRNIVSNAWLDFISRGTRDSKSIGILNDDWGKVFEKHVREKISQSHPELVVKDGRTKIKRIEYPDIVECTSNPNPEIDVIAQSDAAVYLISCKAMDYWISFDNLVSFFLQDYKSFLKAIEADLKNTKEISQLAECIRQSPSFLENQGFSDRKIIPLLVCPDKRPLSLASVRQWCLDMELAYELPEVKIIRASELRDFTFA